jgi:hypothetical protein
VFAYLRQHEEESLFVALNFGASSQEVNLAKAGKKGELLCSTLMDREGDVNPERLALRPGEGVVVRLRD